MFILIPTGHEQATVRRLPWVTITIIALNVVLFLGVGLKAASIERRATRQLERVFEYWREHPYLQMPPELLRESLSPREQEQLKMIREAFQHAAPEDAEERAHQQDELNRLAQEAFASRDEHPFFSWGLIPAHPTPLAFITCMFMHAGWLHLLSNMFIFFLSGPAVEDVYGRPLFATLYLGGGVIASLVHLATFPSSDSPLIGASGAIAAAMGAFMVRFARTRIRFFYVLFLVRGGTFTAPAWFMLGLWLLQQLFYASLVTEGSGVAYAAHAGGFLAGAGAALIIKRLGVEEKVINPAIEKEVSLSQHPALEEGMALLVRGELEAARAALGRALADEPRNPDVHLALWQTYVNEKRGGDGARHMQAVIDHELRSGEYQLALEHWRELRHHAGVSGSAMSRWRLAGGVAATNPEAEIEILRTLVGDSEAEALGDKAARRLETLGVRAEPLPPPPPPPVDEPPSPWEKRDSAQEAPEQPKVFEVEVVIPEARNEDGLLLRGGDAGTELAAFSDVAALAAAGITGEGKPYLLIDLITLEQRGVRVLRLVSSHFDPRHVVGRPDLSPLNAFRELLKGIVTASGARVVVGQEGIGGGRFPMFETVEGYEDAVLTPFKLNPSALEIRRGA